jgi:lipoprotein-releasing system ATP-binding protein
MKKVEPLIRTEGLNKSFSTQGGSLHVLKDIDLDVYSGEMVAIMGPSGAGKSTLLHILGALDRPSSGRVLYAGREIFRLDDDGLASFRNRRIGFVFQFHHLLPEFTAIENTMMPALINGLDWQEATDRAYRLLREVGLSERLTHRPGELSGGEQQRVAVARALMLQPDVVLADEPTGNLDTKTAQELFELMLALNRDRKITFIVVTHNEALASRCMRVIRMIDGRIIQG